MKYLKIEFYLLLSASLFLLFHINIYAISLGNQMNVLLILSLLVGVPHGALDFLVDKQSEENGNKLFSIKKFVAVYLFKLFLFGLCWIFPWLAFGLFMLLSIFHFGETDMFPLMKENKSSTFLNFSSGTLILSVLIGSHLGEIQEALPIIPNYFFEFSWYKFLQQNVYIIILPAILFFLSALIYNYINNSLINITLLKVIEIVVLLTLLYKLPILLAFTFYFAIWHSTLSVRNIFSYFRNFNNLKNFNIICLKSLLFSAVALLGIVVIYYSILFISPNMNMLFALLVVLSLLTLPHLMVMHNMYLKFNKKLN